VFVLLRTVEHLLPSGIPAVRVLVIPVFQCAAMNYDLKFLLRAGILKPGPLLQSLALTLIKHT